MALFRRIAGVINSKAAQRAGKAMPFKVHRSGSSGTFGAGGAGNLKPWRGDPGPLRGGGSGGGKVGGPVIPKTMGAKHQPFGGTGLPGDNWSGYTAKRESFQAFQDEILNNANMRGAPTTNIPTPKTASSRRRAGSDPLGPLFSGSAMNPRARARTAPIRNLSGPVPGSMSSGDPIPMSPRASSARPPGFGPGRRGFGGHAKYSGRGTPMPGANPPWVRMHRGTQATNVIDPKKNKWDPRSWDKKTKRNALIGLGVAGGVAAYSNRTGKSSQANPGMYGYATPQSNINNLY